MLIYNAAAFGADSEANLHSGRPRDPQIGQLPKQSSTRYDRTVSSQYWCPFYYVHHEVDRADVGVLRYLRYYTSGRPAEATPPRPQSAEKATPREAHAATAAAAARRAATAAAAAARPPWPWEERVRWGFPLW